MSSEEKAFLYNIYQFGKRKLFLETVSSLSDLILILLVLWISLALADCIFYFSELTRWGLLFINICIILYVLNFFFLRPLKQFLLLKSDSNLTSIAALIGRYYPEIKDSLVNAYHLISRSSDKGVSDDLRKAAIKAKLDQYGNRDFKSSLKVKQYLPQYKTALPVLISALILLSFKFGEISHSSLRLLNPYNEYLILPPYHFEVEPGGTRVIKGESIELKVRYSGPALSNCFLVVRNTEDGNEGQDLPMIWKRGIYTAAIKDIRNPIEYQIKGIPLNNKQLNNKIWSKTYKIGVLIPPFVKNLDVTLFPPAYSGLPVRHLDRNIGDIAALAGTVAKFKIETNKEIESGSLIFALAIKQNLNIIGKRLNGNFTITKDDSYKIMLQDTSGLANLKPIDYQISLLPDNAPFIEITEPGHDVETQLDASIQLKIEANDDFGFSEIRLYYKYLRSSEAATDTIWRTVTLRLENKKIKRQEFYFLWDFDELPLTFDDGIKYYALAKDNNSVNTPGVGKSKTFYIRFPSLDELFESFTKNEEEEIDKLEEVSKESDNLKKTIEEINRELKRAQEIDWDKKQHLEKTLEQQKEIQEKIEEIRKNLEELVEKLDANNLISEEVLEKYVQLQELFREIATPELMQAMERLQKALDEVNPKDVKRALEQFKLNQEAFKKNLERTIELLKQVQLEQKLDQLVQKAKSLLEQQEKISKKLNKKDALNDDDFNQLKEQQKQQESKFQQLHNDLENFLQEPRLNKFPQTKEMLESTLMQMNDPLLSEQMQDMKQSLSLQQQKDAANSSQQLQGKFAEIKNSLALSQKQMLNKNKMQVKKKMANALQRMLQLSHSQESLHKRTKKASTLSDAFKDISTEQGRVMENFQKVISDIVQLSKETFFINPGMSRSLRKAQTSMGQSLYNLSERSKGSAVRNQEMAMSGLNESIMQLHQSMSQLAKSQSGTGFEQFMEQLQRMAGGQGQINEETLNLFQGQGNSGMLTIEQQQAMKRLAARQAALKEALEEMDQQMGNRQDMLGRMGELSGKMEEVVQDLLKQNVDRKTIERQQQILSRMLDAQKSIKEREYSKKRKAEKAKYYRIKDPGELGNTSDLEKKAIRDALKRALNEGYTEDYQKLIEAYFKSLIQNQTE